jgi:hypothetical protein
MIVIKETETNYLLSIPITQKERAKKIMPRRWDPQQSVWVYPKTKKIYDELIAEFGEDNLQIMAQKPKENANPVASAHQQAENEQLKNELQEIKQSLQLMATSTKIKEEPKVQDLVDQIDVLNAQILLMTQQLDNKENEINELQKKNSESLEQATKLRLLLENQESQKQDFDVFIKERAKEATSNDPKFCKIIDQNKIGIDLLLDLNNKMFAELKQMLNTNEIDTSLSDLINQASDADFLTSEARDYAHIIRKERNKIVHDNAYSKTRDARIIMCLFAAALLWPNFPE